MSKRGLHEPTEVDGRFGEDGRISLRSFTWKGRRLPVVSEGRRRDTPDGFRVLVMTTLERVYELEYNAKTGQWHVVRASEERFNV